MATNAVAGTIQYNAVVNTSGLQSGLNDADSMMGKAAKAGLAATAAIAAAGIAATAGLVASSVKAFATYEQMTGGVQTLFKQSSGIVEAYAQNAYKTAGLSANQYMSTITGFSATLLQGLGGDTKKAAEIGNLAVTDMADNANKMGTSMETIQETYQGFAKDNFDMLDNLKLGYGGTQAEMARLINNSGVMGAGFKATAENVKDIPFDKMIEAIHKVQTEMGITGTTAKEASITISGSFNAVKAAWENVLTSFGTGSNEMIKASIDGLVESARNLITNIIAILPNIITGIASLIGALVVQLPAMLQLLVPAFTNILLLAVQTIVTTVPQFINAAIQLITALVQGLATAMPTIIPQIMIGIQSMISTIVQNLPLFLAAAVQVIVALVTGLAQAAPTLIPQIIDAALKMLDALLKQLPLLIQAGVQLLVAVVQGLAKALPTLISYIPSVVNTLVTELTKPSVIILLIKASLQIMLAIANGLIQAIPQLINTIPQIIGSIIRAFDNIGSVANSIGDNLVKGIWNGINNAKNWVISKIQGFGSAVLDGLKNFFGIHSPSTLFRDEIGKNLALGVGAGFTETMDGVAKDMQGALPSSSFDINSVGSSTYTSGDSQPTTVIVKIGEDQIASKVIDLINDRSKLSGTNQIYV